MAWIKHNELLVRNSPVGCFVEVGVFEGDSAKYLYGIAQEQIREIYLFDTFDGHPHKSEFDYHDVGSYRAAQGTFDKLKQEMPKAHIFKGIFPLTMPSYLNNIAFVHEDTDQYESTKAVIETLYPNLIPGGIMLFDDYHDGNCLGSKKAIDECGYAIQFTDTNPAKAYIQKPF